MSLSAVPGWMEKMEEEQHVEDEFTCPGVLRGALLDQKSTVERVFRVVLRISGEENAYTARDGQIWLLLKGRKKDTEAAKLFVKGLVSQEAQRETQYPDVLHCVFCGSKEFFMDCLIRMTSAHIVVGSPGCLLISGLAEPVVKAFSLIIDLVEKYRNSQKAKTGKVDESLDSRRAFKSLVERLEDDYTLELLALPVLVKEVLLDLVKQSEGDLNTLDSFSTSAVQGGMRTLTQIPENVERLIVGKSLAQVDHAFSLKQNHIIPADSPRSCLFSEYGGKDRDMNMIGDKRPEPGGEMYIKGDPHNQFFCNLVRDVEPRTRGEGAECAEVTSHKREQPKWFGSASQSTGSEQRTGQQEERLQATGNKQEHEHLLQFFTAMGFDAEVVSRVLARTGPREASQVLDLVQQEQDKSCSNAEAPDREALPELRRDEGMGENGAPGAKEEDSDFVLGVVKKAAATCGYTEDNVAKVYGNNAELNPHELILGLQKVGMKDPENAIANERRRAAEMEEQQLFRTSATLQKVKQQDLRVENSSSTTWDEKPNNDRGTSLREKPTNKEGILDEVETRRRVASQSESDANNWGSKLDLPSPFQNQPLPVLPLSVRGPPQLIYPSTPFSVPGQHMMGPIESTATKPKQKQGPPPGRAGTVVTGPQRFQEGLKTPFALQLTNDSGDPGLRHIIIDGSNVAMTHGLGMFFSCRGIALAVQHFWSRGHRQISVFVPQWRQKRDPKIKEHHFMTQLQDLGLLSYTPSREVKGERINSYDDRIMLQLAQKTDGVIVTNDNMRDLVDESATWREIIKKRLLQYLFAGDNFMVPDDPLGRSGPHINDFLRAQNSPPIPGSHSFAGVASPFAPPTEQPRAHTEVLHYRERTPGGGRAQEPGRSQTAGDRVMDRSVEDTQRLKRELVKIFPGQESVVMMMLQCHPAVSDINQLSYFILEQQTDTEEQH